MIRCIICYSKFLETINFDSLFDPSLVCEDCLLAFKKVEDCCEYCSHPKGYKCCDKTLYNTSIFLENQHLKNVLFQIKYLNLVEKIFVFEKFVFDICKKKYDDYIVVPVPLSKAMYEKRGFNQSYLLACFTKLDLKNCLVRIDNKTQSQKSYVERITNPPQFKLNYLPRCRKVLVVDDIYTTGTTLKEIYKLFPKDYEIKFLTIQRTTIN